MILDHVGISVSDFPRAKAFYEAVLGTLGITVLSDLAFGPARHAGFGKTRPDFWISSGREGRAQTHVCFRAESRAAVEAFYSVALSMGGRDNGPPGLRVHYHPDYYAAYVLDPDGHNVEAVCHDKP
jgi:catechol 2,3-dioxygenase-like lactoylglutathione lyase family enzyme